MFLRGRGKALLATYPLSTFKFDVNMTFMVYIYIAMGPNRILFNFLGVCKHNSSSQLASFALQKFLCVTCNLATNGS
jgi:hypothetical protein